MCNIPQQAPIGKVPKDGLSQCYTSRVLNSTSRYVKFVKRLRAQEEEQRRGAENNLKTYKDQQNSDFFIRCDRRSLINNVARRVDLCMASYQEDLKRKRQRLVELYTLEEEANIRKFVVQAQAGAEAVWQDKKARLQYLLEKRKKEHEEKYKDTPLSKCVHVLPCIYKLRAKEAADIQQYQIREKAARKMAEHEFDKMWHAVAMKESDALKARMEQDAIERYRRDLECKTFSDMQLEQNRIKREQERELMKEEMKRFQSIWEEDNLKEEEAERMRQQKRVDMALDRKATLEEKRELQEKLAAEEKVIADTWDSLASQGLAEEQAKIQLARKKEDIRDAMMNQIKDRKEAREALQEKLAEQDEYQRQLFGQLEQLTQLKEKADAEERKKHQEQLIAQMEYNKTLKERARQVEIDQTKKAQLAKEEYQEEIKRMMSRPFFSEEVHPFMKQMTKGLEIPKPCPCSRGNYCQN